MEEIQTEIMEPDSEIYHSKSSIDGIYVQENSFPRSPSPIHSIQPEELGVDSFLPEDLEEAEFEYEMEDIVRIKEEGVIAVEKDEDDQLGESSGAKSGKTTSFPRPRLIPKVDMMDIKYCSFQDRSFCSNCYEKLSCDNQGKKFADMLCRRKVKTEIGSDQVCVVTVLEALDVIFELNKNSFLSEIILDEMEYSICRQCCSILSKLYKFYIEFAECSEAPSYIKSIITRNKALYAHQESISKKFRITAEEQGDDRNECNEYDDGGPLMNVEISFQEEEDSYVPPDGAWGNKFNLQRPNGTAAVSRRSRKRPHSARRADDIESGSPGLVSSPPVKRGRGRPRKVPLPPSSAPVVTLQPIKPIKSPADSTRKPDSRREKDRRLNYKCGECSARFSRPSRLKRHSTVHTGRKYVCAVCNAGFNFAIYLERHEVTHSTTGNADGESDGDFGERKMRMRQGKMKVTTAGGNLSREERRRAHVCRDCGLVFTKPSGLLRHLRIHENVSYSCDQSECSSEFTSRRLLIRHKIQDHQMTEGEVGTEEVKPLLGNLIRRRLQRDTADLYTRLEGNKQTRRYKCPECPQTFFRTDHIRRHARAHLEKKEFCEACNAGFSTMKYLVAHMKVAHSEMKIEDADEGRNVRRKRIPRMKGRQKYICPEADCGHVFSSSNYLKQHLQSKHNIEPSPRQSEEPQTCPVCSLVVKSKSRLDSHLQKHRPLIRQNNHECDICGKKYRDANNLRNHKASHRLDKPYICDKCGFATKRSYQLTRHIEMVHVGTRSHLCTECGQSFKKKQHLRDHEQTHNAMEYRPYTCTLEGCTKAYRSRRNLRQHLEAHTGCKFQCETCGRIFTRKDNLKVHVDTVHLGKPGRAQKEKVKVVDGTSPAKKPRKPKQSLATVEHIIHLLPDDGDGPGGENPEVARTHQVMIVDEANLQHIQQQQHFHHILANPRIIHQQGTVGTVPGQSVVAIPNPFGEFFYTI